MTLQAGLISEPAQRNCDGRGSTITFLILVGLMVIQLPTRAESQDTYSLPTSGGPALGGTTAGMSEGGGLAVSGALATADSSTGIAHSSYSFHLETARGKVQPSLGLTYDSADGQREAGIGWGLNIPSIERHNVSGGPKYLTDPEQSGAVTAMTDRFEFGGSPLVPVCHVDDSGDCKGKLQGEVMPPWATFGWNYFRLAVDNSHERFFWSPDHQTWRVQTKSGETREYGVPIDDPTDDGAVDRDRLIHDGTVTILNSANRYPNTFRWNLVRRRDPMNDGNVVIYRWQHLWASAIGVSAVGSLSDIYDTSSPAEPSNLNYFAHHTQLIWLPDPAAVPASLQPNIYKSRPLFRLDQVNIWSMGFEGGGARGLVRSYTLIYYPAGSQSVNYARSLLKSIQMTGACPNAYDDNSGELNLTCMALPPTTFTYTTASAQLSWTKIPTDIAVNSSFVDLDGDGYPDAVSAADTRNKNSLPEFARNKGGASFARPTALPEVHHLGNPGVDSFYFDNPELNNGFSFGNWAKLNGPGTDAFFDSSVTDWGYGSGFFVFESDSGNQSLLATAYGSDNSSPQHPWCFTGNLPADWPENFSGVADIDGDGFLDCWSIPTDRTDFSVPPTPFVGLTTLGPTGSINPFVGTAYPNHLQANFSLSWNMKVGTNFPGSWTGAYAPQLVDITGDGIPDLVWLWNTVADAGNAGDIVKGYISVIVGNGDGTFGNGFTIPLPHCGTEWPYKCSVALVDLNGDGFADFVAMDTLGTTIILSAGVTANGITWGQQFQSASPFPVNASSVEMFGPESADLNASGVTDLLFVTANNPTAFTGFEQGTVSYLDLLGGQSPPLLKTISNGLGATTTLTYASTASLGLAAESAGHPWGKTSTQSLHVVTSIETDLIGNSAAGGPFITSYEYHGASADDLAGAMYDKRFRRFNGFCFVRTKQIDQSKPGVYDVTDTYFEPSLSSVTPSPDLPWDALKGMAVFSSRYAMSGESKIIEPFSSSHTEYLLTRLYRGIDDRIVRQVIPETVDTWLYDSAKPMGVGSTTFVPMQDVEDSSNGPISVSAARNYAPLPWPSSHSQSTLSVDDFGNVVSVNDGGVLGKDKAIIRSSTWATVDKDWNWRATHTSVKYAGDATDRQYDFTYDNAGNLLKVTGNLSGTLAIRQNLAQTPKNASPQSNPALLLASMSYDPNFGNLVTATTGSDLRIVKYQYDPGYQQFLTRADLMNFDFNFTTHTEGSLSTTVVYDRGLEVPTQITDVRAGLTKVAYDIFGRVVSIQEPDTSNPGLADIWSGARFTYTDVPDGPYQRVDVVRHLGSVSAGLTLIRQESLTSIYTDALGGTTATLSSGGAKDPTGQWIVSGMTQRDMRGSVLNAYEPFFAQLQAGLPGAVPPAIPTGTMSVSFLRDPFGRVVESHDLDGSLVRKYVYHDRSLDTYNANDVSAGASAPTYSTVSLDGHGRPIEWDQRTANGAGLINPDMLETKVTYLATGEPSVLTRGSLLQGEQYKRSMQYDSLGRMVLNAEPNTSAWMYAYDPIGELVGTTDARGCGINFTWDFAGREKSEDYIPCTSDQAPYSPVDDSTGNGAEVYNIYDAPEEGEPDANSGGVSAAPFFKGKLAATYSRGEHTQYAYDGRGRVVKISKQMPNPPGATVLSFGANGIPTRQPAGPYAPSWYQTSISYDEAGRPIAQTTGSGVPELQGASVDEGSTGLKGTSVVLTSYDARNIATQVSGSYGVLALGEQHDANGRILRRSYGDVAETTAEYKYDVRRRLAKAKVFRAAPPGLWSTPAVGYTLPSVGAFTTPLILQDLNYVYDSVSNPQIILDERNPAEWPAAVAPVGLGLTYDDLDRLTSVQHAFAPASAQQLPAFLQSDMPPINFKTPQERVHNQAYLYDVLGNVTSSTDDAQALLQRSSGAMSYGSISGAAAGPNQLAQGRSDNAAYTNTYDRAGNLTSISANLPGTSGDNSRLILLLSYRWDEAGHLQQATRYQYNIVPGTTLMTDSSTITNNYLYDGRGVRTWHSSDDSGSTEYFLDVFPSLRVSGTHWNLHGVSSSSGPGLAGHEGYLLWDYDLTPANEQVYLQSGASSYGRLIWDKSLPSPSHQALHTILEITDPQGSTSSAVDKETGELVEQISYLANGGTETDYRPERWNSFREASRYTGKEDDYEVGLVYFGARYLVPGLGRWASPDPLTIHELGSDPNPYSFVRGSPYRFKDPTGLDECDSDSEQVCGSNVLPGLDWDSGEGYTPSGGSSTSSTTPGGGSYGPWVDIYGSYRPPPPPPQPQLIPKLNLDNQVSTTSPEIDWTTDTPFTYDPGLPSSGCDSQHTEKCHEDIEGWVAPWAGAFLLLGKEITIGETTKVGLFAMVGYSDREGAYISVLGERGRKLGPLTGSLGFEKQIISSESGLFEKPGETFVDLNATLGEEGAPGLGAMAPLESNLETLTSRVVLGVEGGSYEFSPYAFFSLGPIEFGGGLDFTSGREWGWKHFRK